MYLDLLQISLDLIGIAEPTPFADGANTAISIARGDWLGTGLSALGMIPYIGDLAKLGKLGRWSETITKVIDLAANNNKFVQAVKPILAKIDDAIAAIPNEVFSSLSAANQDRLRFISRKIESLLEGRTIPTGELGGKPSAPKTPLGLDPKEIQEDLLLENESAEIMANAGYKVEQNPGKRPDNDSEPDYKIEGE